MPPPPEASIQKAELIRILLGLINAYSVQPSNFSAVNGHCSSSLQKIKNSEILNLLKKMPKFYSFLNGRQERSDSPSRSRLQTQQEMEGTRLLICLISLCFQRWNGHLDVVETRRENRSTVEKVEDILLDDLMQVLNVDEYKWETLAGSGALFPDDQASTAASFLTDKLLQPLLGMQ
jgi:hypothetical protein